jgi:hypothetical protein
MNDEKNVVFLISPSDEVLMFDITKDMAVERSGDSTTNTLQDGVKVSDHYHPSLPSVTINGSVHATKVRGTLLSPDKYVLEINKLMDAQTPFTLYGTSDGTIPTLDNCVITSFYYLKTGKDSLDVTLTIIQLDIGMRATLDTLTPVSVPSTNTGSSLASNTDKKTGTKTQIDGVTMTQMLKRERENQGKTVGGG